MIIVDYSGIAIASIFSQDRPAEIEEGLIRHMILNSLRRYNLKFRKDYGQMVIACDSSSWRKETYPQYKAKRKTTRDESPLDWGHLFTLINGVRDEIKENMHYPVVTVDRAEADDIIAELVESTQEFGKCEPVMIVSSDKDFFQLQQYSNVKQFSPMKRDFIKVDDAAFYKFDHICRGDSSDGVPNVLSVDESFTEGIRQKPMRAKKIQEWYTANGDSQLMDMMGQDTYRNYCRNKSVIDFDYIPEDIKTDINNKYNQQTDKNKRGVLTYLIEKRCNMLIDSVADFFPTN
jgi:hypothetical protein|tara:strand:- start:1308 stop:2177 length:870 start_codon:yes stop_codon:yes gene_type:complete